MTLKEMFKKVETYNEVAEVMHTDKAVIYFSDSYYSGKDFETYDSFRKYIRKEYISEVVNLILKESNWEMDGEITTEWIDAFGDTHATTFSAEVICKSHF